MFGWQFSVIDSNAEGVLFEAVKTDIDKFVPPPPKPQQNNPRQPISPIRISRGEVISTGSLTARATWNVTGHQSYRIYVISEDDAQKVFFESRVLNGSQNPIIVNISGLPCNRQVKTMAMFFTEKDGKGERLVAENRDLNLLPCVDTTKKP